MQSYAIIKTGGKQYTVKEGDVLNVELLTEKGEGDTVELTALAASNGGNLSVGSPALDATVKATVVGSGRGKKIIVHKWRRTKGYRRRNGHRQSFHTIRIDSIPG